MNEVTSKQADAGSPSILRQVLENLERMFRCYCMTVSEGAQDALILAFCREATMVCAKLKAMRLRWTTFLPFKEVIDVRFADWQAKVKDWMSEFGYGPEGCSEAYEVMQPDSGFLLDLLQLPVPQVPQLSRDGMEEAMEQYCSEVDRLLQSICLENWDEVLASHVDESLRDVLVRRRDEGELHDSVGQVLRLLHDELGQLDAFFSSELKAEQFIALALRLRHRDCRQAIDEGHKELMRAKNAWPERSWKARAEELKSRLKMRLISEVNGKELMEYIDLDYPDLYGDACFGQYLFKNRHTLTRAMVQDTVKCCSMIGEINQLLDPRGTARRKKEAALGRELTEAERGILKRLEGLAREGKWRNGATADSIILGINRMLGVGYTLEPDMQPLSDKLWQMLKNRKNCDAEKSLRVTWLNIVGWCVSEGLISGGSPALCKDFFPGVQDPDAYKAIDKGRGHQTMMFVAVEPLLAKYLK